MASPASEPESSIQYTRLRAPKQHGESLQVPPLTDAANVWQFNLKLRSSQNANVGIGKQRLNELRDLARAEIVELATRYSKSYLDPDCLTEKVDSTRPIVMAGHQPELFHPGVWYKNFVLSQLGNRLGALAINLIVDHDLSGNASIRYPNTQGNEVTVGSLAIAPPSANIPFENRAVDWEFFQSFAQQAEKVIESSLGKNWSPIINRLLPHFDAVREKFEANGKRLRLGELLAAGRHRLESEVGLRTLEVPISLVSQSISFATFAQHIIGNLERFHTAYNQSLLDYRLVHKIRSNSHPVPELETDGDWLETPFWVYGINICEPNASGQSDCEPGSTPLIRRRLFARSETGKILLTDRVGWKTEIETSVFVEQFCSLAKSGIAIRPKALMTTMYSRLLSSDMFLHGIGGAKYDQLTDVICKRFFETELPSYLTLSATIKLPTDFEIVRRSDLIATNQLIRELKFHPERLIVDPAVTAELITEKQNWTAGEQSQIRSRERHLKIESLNQRLGAFANCSEEELIAKRTDQMKRIRASEILDSREYSFCLFPESLIDELQALAEC